MTQNNFLFEFEKPKTIKAYLKAEQNPVAIKLNKELGRTDSPILTMQYICVYILGKQMGKQRKQ